MPDNESAEVDSTSAVLANAALELHDQAGIPMQRQLADQLRRAIIEGRLALGTRLPSVRELAKALHVSRSTIVRCFEELASQGYIVTAIGSGTTVCNHLPGDIQTEERAPLVILRQPAEVSPDFLSDYAKRLLPLTSENTPPAIKKLNPGGPPMDTAPIQRWRELFERHCRLQQLVQLEQEFDLFGFPPLREAYAAYLTRNRAVRCSADQVVVFMAREMRLDVVARILLEPGDLVAVENPGYPGARQRFHVHGARILPVPVDHQGMDVDFLANHHEQIRIVYVTPSHHEPTGVVMPISRRKKLLEWASKNGAYIVEDDYDSEYRYDSRPMPSLQGLDDSDSVIHLSCLWKVLSPVSKIGFLTIPRSLIEIFSCTKKLIERDAPVIDQFVLADFINEGYLERQIKKNRKLYAERRERLVQELKNSFGLSVTTASESAGMDLFVRFDLGFSDDKLSATAIDAGLKMSPARPYYITGGQPGEFIIPFSLMGTAEIQQAVRRFKALLV